MAALALLATSCTGAHKKTTHDHQSPVADAPLAVKQRTLIQKLHQQQAAQSEATPPANSITSPDQPTVFIPKMPGNRISHVNVPGRYVALTFDDGPNPATTPKVLDILQRRGAKATFFVLGSNAGRNKQILARAVAEGHEIGSHTWSHSNLTKLSQAALRSEIDRTSAVIQEATGHRPSVLRPPYGATNAHMIDMIASQYGMPSILWDVDTQDWKHPGVDVVVQRVLSKTKSGSIILLHDIHSSTVDAVDRVVAGLQARGFTLVTVSELIDMGKRAAANTEMTPPAQQGWLFSSTAPGDAPQQEAQPELVPLPGSAQPTTGEQVSAPPAEADAPSADTTTTPMAA